MASVSASTKVQRPSFAKIAAAGLKAPSAQQSPTSADNAQKHGVISSPPDGTNIVAPSNIGTTSSFTPTQKSLVPHVSTDSKETDTAVTDQPQVNVESAEAVSPTAKTPRALDGMLMPSTSDEAATQVSSSSGSGKPPSLDGKSVTSVTTFALDEKESLRPDDSASVKATEDEDSLSRAESGVHGSRTGSDDNVRAFRDQLREISGMEPQLQPLVAQGFDLRGNLGQILYNPEASSAGMLPSSALPMLEPTQVTDLPPDPKLLEALESPKDRIMVLKLEQDIVDFVKDPKESSLKLPQTNAFYRMLAHKLADYYMLGHLPDESTMSVRIFKTPHCRLPPPLTGIATPSTAASTPPPTGLQMKILRRGVDGVGPVIANGSNLTSKTTSENGESGNDAEKKLNQHMSREEKEAKYEAARKRIMGSARPTDSPEASEKDNSRSSSAAEKKGNRKKQRADSDDDFEARSAYSTYYPPNTTTGGPTAAVYGASHVESPNNHISPSPFGSQGTQGNFQQFAPPPTNAWANQGFPGHDGTSNWIPNPQPGYDLPGDFQRALSFQPSPMMNHGPNMQPGYAQYNQQYVPPQQNWPAHNPYMPAYPSQPGPGYMQGYPSRPQSSSGSFHDPYPYGQLPSQTFPGRQPSRLEHPIPGSYKGKHFNPQSRSFIPAQGSNSNAMPLPSQAPPMNYPTNGSGYGIPGQMQQESHALAPNPSFGPPQQVVPPNGTPRSANHPLTHPLPQPVFPRQPSPNMPLPPKPEATPVKPAVQSNSGPAIVSSTPNLNLSSIAKWDRPASLPAKPPPPAEPLDPAMFGHGQRVPSFGTMPPPVNGNGMTGQSTHAQRRG